RRLETRAGEVSKAVTVRNDDMISQVANLARKLPGARGAISIQAIAAPDGRLSFIEINARFGGGFPLSAAAGANFPRWLIEWELGRSPNISMFDFEDGVTMLRFDDAVFLERSALA